MTKVAAMNLKTMRANIRVAKWGQSQGFVYLSPTGCPCRVIPPPDHTPRARDGMHVQITFWSRYDTPIFEVHAQSLN
jgi:hypothetical protein